MNVGLAEWPIPEDLTGWIAFTFSPAGNTISPKYAYHDWVGWLKKTLGKRLKWTDYLIIPELNHSGNIHFHGIIKVIDKVKWFKCILPTIKYKGFVCIKTELNAKWIEYMRKDYKDMCNILELEECFFTPSLPEIKDLYNPEDEPDVIQKPITYYFHPEE